MIHAHTWPTPEPATLNRTYTLAGDITAMQILPCDETGARLSPVCKLPRGAHIQACGAGYDPETLKVVYEGQYYLVFLNDLETQRKAAASAN